MGIVPLQFLDGQSAEGLGLTGREVFSLHGVAKGLRSGFADGREVEVVAHEGGAERRFIARVRIDTPQEVQYVLHGGILQYVLRRLARG